MPPLRPHLHLRDYHGIDKRADQECQERCQRHPRCKTENSVECLVVPTAAGQHIDQRTQHHKQEIHGKGHPNQLTGAAESPHLCHHIIDDVTDGKHQQSTGEMGRPNGKLLQSKQICCQQAGGEQSREYIKQLAHLLSLIFHVSCFVKGGFQAPLWLINRLQRYEIFSTYQKNNFSYSSCNNRQPIKKRPVRVFNSSHVPSVLAAIVNASAHHGSSHAPASVSQNQAGIGE